MIKCRLDAIRRAKGRHFRGAKGDYAERKATIISAVVLEA